MIDRGNILVVDDETGPRESLRMILGPYYNIYMADRGGQAIEILHQIPIDVVTVDLKMPGLTGIKLLEKVKQHDQDIEAIIITGYGSMDTAVEGLRLGAFDYVSKPFDVNHILSQVKRALERRNARLKLKELKSDFLANVSHELRTPLSVVIGFVSLLLDQAIGEITEDQRKVIEKVYRNSDELLALIDNVLWLTYLNAGDVFLAAEEFDVGLMIQETVERWKKIQEEKGINVSIQLPSEAIRILSDPSKVTRIFQNIFQNALKFTLQGHITIRADWSMDERSVEFEIVDTGIGIPRDEIENVFQPFRQLDSSPRRKFPGLGIGLTVARRLTDFLGGTLQIKSQPGIGTRVLLNIPCPPQPQKGDIPHNRY